MRLLPLLLVRSFEAGAVEKPDDGQEVCEYVTLETESGESVEFNALLSDYWQWILRVQPKTDNLLSDQSVEVVKGKKPIALARLIAFVIIR